MEDEKEVRAMRERRDTTRDCYEDVLIAKGNRAISAIEDDITLLSEEEDISKTTTTTTTTTTTATTLAGAEISKQEEDEDNWVEQSKSASANTMTREMQQQQQHAFLWPWALPLIYIFLVLLVRGFFWIISFLLMTTTEGENKPLGPHVNPHRLVNPCDTGQDSEYCSIG